MNVSNLFLGKITRPQTPETPASNSSRESTEERRTRVRRQLFTPQRSPIESPQFQRSPESLGDLFNDAILEDLHFDPENFAAALFNDQIEEPIQFEEIPVQEEIILVPVEEPAAVPIEEAPAAAVPIEEEPPAAVQIDEPIGESFTIQIQNDRYKSDEQEMEETLDRQIENIEAAMTPPDYCGYIPIREE